MTDENEKLVAPRRKYLPRAGIVAIWCPAFAGVLWLLCRLYAEHLVAEGQGWEMAFYFSPIAFLIVDLALVAGVIAAGIAAFGPIGWKWRIVTLLAGATSAVSFVLAYWRGSSLSLF
jgi:hypothetical protein